MKILISKVNAYDTTTVIRLFDILGMIFKSVGSHLKGHLPINFNYKIFFKALKIIIEGDSAMTVTAALTLVYTHFPLFHIDFRRNISMYFLGSAFNNVFLHWSHNVRYVFHHLLAFRIYKDALPLETGMMPQQQMTTISNS